MTGLRGNGGEWRLDEFFPISERLQRTCAHLQVVDAERIGSVVTNVIGYRAVSSIDELETLG
jgi:hypothetical protein